MPSDLFGLGTYNDSGPSSSAGVSSGDQRYGSDLKTGDLRRRYNFGDRVSELAIAQDPFFRFVSKIGKKPTDDPEFKYTERRPSYHKRYAYVSNHHATTISSQAGDDANVVAGALDTDDIYKFAMVTDYLSEGNLQNVYGQSTGKVQPGDSGTQPAFFLPGQIVRIPYAADGATFAADYSVPEAGYILVKITDVDLASVATCAIITGRVVKGVADAVEMASYITATNGIDDVDIQSKSIAGILEPKRCYVVGTAHGQGTGFPQTWKDQPFSTGYGHTQIFKTSLAMDNTTRATVLKYEPNEWARIWREKLIEHKWDIETALLYGSQFSDADGVWQTQGAVDFVSSYGNVFELDHTTKTQDQFLDDMSNFLDPRYNNANATLFFVDTATFNWLHKLSGYFQNNLEISPNFSANMSLTGKKKVFGVDITTISTPYGDMNVARNVHLDSSAIKILAVNMRYCSFRPLVGNGINRDTAIYVGVQTLENSGVDRRVDLIQTEAGMEWQMPEAHAYWA